MAFKLFTTREADRDLEEILLSLIENSSQSTAKSFLNEFERISDRILQNPYLYQSYFLFIHRVNFRRFPYFVAYAIDSINMTVDVVMIAHQQVDPDRLARRLNL